MAKQRQVRPHEDKKETVSDKSKSSVPKNAERGKKIKKDIDSLIGEIDAILEENAEKFMKSYVQRGGE